jgi:Asp-tRNA(Asn)/Glu-tRNA(Gln) amidotransferase B subunit
MPSQLKKDEDAEKVYNMFFEDAMHLLNEHQIPVELVAGTMVAIAQRLYKTHLSDEDYKDLMKEIMDHPDVEPYGMDKVRLH